MKTETTLQWHSKKEGRLASRNIKGLNIALHDQSTSNKVQTELSKKRSVYFKIRDGKILTQSSHGKNLCRSHKPDMFSASTDLTVMAVPNKQGGVKLHLDKKSKRNLKELDKQRRGEKFSKALDGIQKHGKQQRKTRSR